MRVSPLFLLGLAISALTLLIGLLAGGVAWLHRAAGEAAGRFGRLRGDALASAPPDDAQAPMLLNALLHDLWPALVLLLLVSAAGAGWLYRAEARRLRARLERAAVQVGRDGPGLQLAATGDREQDRLVDAFNRMSRRLAAGQSLLRQALASAERTAAETSEREAHLRRLFGAAQDAILTLDDAGRVVDLNAAAERFLAIDAAVLRGRSLDACIDFELMDTSARALLRGSLSTPNSPLRGELELVCVGGQQLPVEVAVSLLRGPAGSFRILFMRDIAARRRTQAQLQERARRADVANEAKTRFLAAMSHEIRTPLNAILNMNELLLESSLDEEQRNYAATAGESARVLMSIVNSVLDFSKIEGGRVEPAPLDTDPEEIVRSIVDLLAARAHAHGLELTVFCDPMVPERIDTDPGLMRQILLNLLGNAIRFTDAGMVGVRLERGADAGMLHIRVIDTGVGIPPEDQAELFSEFQQAQAPGGRRQGGSGLGLAISRRLARLLGGNITLESVPGKGSCFTLALPLPTAVPAGARASAAAPLGAYRVSLWADNRLLAGALAEQLRAFGVAVSVSCPAPAGVPDGCCGGIRLLRRVGGAAAKPREIALYRIGSRFVAPAGESWVASLRIPVTPSTLVAALGEALRKVTATTAPADDLAERVARHAARALPVLLAEDSRSNQVVATGILGKAGFRVDIAENGLQAVAAVGRQDYSLVLMDVAMPEMDGIEATSCIRALPGQRGSVPIVAMTANAFDEDRRRCLQAGMDGYLSKPIDRRALFEAVLQFARADVSGSLSTAAGAAAVQLAAEPHGPLSGSPTREASAQGQARGPQPDSAAQPVLDERVIAALASDLSAELMPEVVATFVEEARERIVAIERAVATGDGALAADEGHTLKGSAATFGAVALHDIALAIEQAGQGGDLAALESHLSWLRGCGDAVLSELQARYGDDLAAS